MEKAYFALGCFWAPEADFRKVNGVVDAAVGYSGGYVPEPDYHMVCRGKTGHAETVEVTFDPGSISYSELLKAFYSMHNPLQSSQSSIDITGQYRSAIFCVNDEQLSQATAFRDQLQEEVVKKGLQDLTISTEIAPLKDFWRAEEYHQQYYAKKGGDATCGTH